ncbi:MAG: sodium:calcium antiporter [Sphaerobacteraceae bacterium]|nr:MAG: sodium:calcium antiporter [Sphaerobacteraceae bacterium]
MSLLTILFIIAGLVLLVGGAEVLVRGATRLSLALGISPLVIGLTVVAYGTSSPEVAVTLQAGFAGDTDLALGNVIGSNIANILLVLGMAALVAPLVVRSQLVRFDVPIMIGASVLLLVLAMNGSIGRIESGILALGAFIYSGVVLYIGTRKGTVPVDIPDESEFVTVERQRYRGLGRHLVYIVIGLVLLVLGSRWLVQGAVEVAEALGVSQMIIGLTVVAIGTSLPEVATSVIASIKGERDLAVGNVVGSNIFNIFLVLGVAGFIVPVDIPVPSSALNFDLLVMIAVAVACLPIFFTGAEIARWEGGLFLGYFVAYTAYLVLRSQDHEVLPEYSQIMLAFVIPLTVITLIVLSLHAIHTRRKERTALNGPDPGDDSVT